MLAADPSAFTDLANRNASLRSLGIGHGGLVYLRYSVERVVTPTTALDTRPFGAPARPPLLAPHTPPQART